jgi:hypothetical protein
MSVIVQVRELDGSGMLALAFLFMAPSALALFASYVLLHGALYYASALWFVYEISFYLGIVGICLTVALVITSSLHRGIPGVFVWLMGVVAIASAFLDWYAAHIYRSPWSS